VQAKRAAHSAAEITHWMGVTDANSAGNIHGGVIMRLADEAAALAAIKHARLRVVTVGMDRMAFLVPIYVGELVTFKATVNAAWRSSMEVGVRVEAEDPTQNERRRHTNTAYLTMVALGEDGRPAEVPALEAVTPDEQRRCREAELRRANRLAERAEIITRRAQERPPSGATQTESG
jgi:acyl-CoA hydrolase